ncbi:alpha/beta hydrolase [Actinoplanes sp. TBRC 11911]|uniref:alpha/beta fold hydrolase n=1 Tax=Actinoplanes sp. TBRC 11911 TaxID=2729386 RepID=UPI00145CE4E4|nr:alpha/beta hydrolase [Actinoplanes sp. TBRC 11911]NMO57689.1 alpha/beta hydrolase [Actinoplanes sp. TBRC 11911]
MRISRNILRTTAVAGLAAVTLAACGGTASEARPSRAEATAKPTVVLVHGAWADGSSWAPVADRLQGAGFTVDIEPNPLRGLASDVRYLKDYLASVAGPVVLVGHSYGGMVITAAATGNANVKALVYVNAYIPQQGDTIEKLTAAQPGSALDPKKSIDAVPIRDASGKDIDVDVYVKRAEFARLFAAGIPAGTAAALAASQRPLTLSSLTEPFTAVPAWTTIPSWAFIGSADRVLPPNEQQVMAGRAHAHVVRGPAPHLSMVSSPTAVTAVISDAARQR